MGLVPFAHLVRHAQITGNIALIHNLSLEHLRYKTVTQRQEQRHNAQGNAQFLKKTFIHFGIRYLKVRPARAPWHGGNKGRSRPWWRERRRYGTAARPRR